jgi:neuronal cell adhesion molecule
MLKILTALLFILFDSYYIERKTSKGLAAKPDPPKFGWERLDSNNGLASIQLNWQPNLEGKPGSHFFGQYR